MLLKDNRAVIKRWRTGGFPPATMNVAPATFIGKYNHVEEK